jgi:hypothetical protein
VRTAGHQILSESGFRNRGVSAVRSSQHLNPQALT